MGSPVDIAQRLRRGTYFGKTRSRHLGSVGFAESAYEEGTVLPEHTHEDDHLVLVVCGQYDERVDGKRALRQQAQLTFLPREVPHAEWHHAAGRHFMIDTPRKLIERVDPAANLLQRPALMPVEASNLALQLYERFRDPDWVSPLIMRALTIELLASCTATTAKARARRPPPYLRRAFDHISRRYAEELKTADLARDLQVHPGTLKRTFRRCYGAPLNQFLQERRLEVAYRDVLHTNKPLTDIAGSAGFCDQSYFGTIFRATFAMSPGKLRRHAGAACRSAFASACPPPGPSAPSASRSARRHRQNLRH